MIKETNLLTIVLGYLNHKILTQDINTPYISIIRANLRLSTIVNEHYRKMYLLMEHFNVDDDFEREFYDKTLNHLYYHVDKYIDDFSSKGNVPKSI